MLSRVFIAAFLLAFGAACSTGTAPDAYPCGQSEAGKYDLVLTPVPATGFDVPVAGTLQLSATARQIIGSKVMPDNGCMFLYGDVLLSANGWTSSNTNVAEVNAHGLVTGVGVGVAEIRATFAGLDLVGRFDISVHMT